MKGIREILEFPSLRGGFVENNREEIIDTLANKYFCFLNMLPFEDELMMKGLQEGKGKFLANLHIHLTRQGLPKGWKHKLYSTDFVTSAALDALIHNRLAGLEYEHLIPKKRYIQDICEQKAKDGTLSEEFIKELLEQYLWTATVTSQEHRLLSRSIMPDNWDETNIKYRYEQAGIDLINHNRAYMTRVMQNERT